jgi:peptidoglycan/LPS O-acetylase OafA/YrhL
VNFLFKLTNISNIKRVSFRQDINGLRAVAVLAVVFYHAELEIFKGGWLGVDIFFVISGYLISNIIISELNEGTFSFKTFYLRRVKRIIPALFSTLLLTIPFAYFFLTPKAMKEYTESLTASVFFFANYHFMNVDFYISESAKLMPLLHTWSLAIEEQYYLLFPLFAFIVYKYFNNYFTFVVGLITLTSLYLNSFSQSFEKFYRLEFRFWELLLGVLVMILSSNIKVKHLEKIGLPFMFFPIFYFDDSWINDVEPKLLALIGISFILFSNTSSSLLTKALSYKIISIIGLSSYSIYLLHQPIYAFYRVIRENFALIRVRYFELDFTKSIDIFSFSQFNIENSLNGFAEALLYSLCFLLTLFLGFLSYKFIEKPSFENSNYKMLIFFFVLLSIFIILNPKSALESNISFEIPEESNISEFDCWNKYNLYEDNFKPVENCFINNNSNNNLLILGDSSTVSISKNILSRDLFNDYNIYFLSVSHEGFFIDYDNQTNCNNCFFTWVQNNPTTIVVSVEFHRFIEKNGIYNLDEDNNNKDIFKKNMNYLSKFSKNLLILEPFPTMPTSNINPLDLIRLDEFKEISEIYIPYSTWDQNTILTSNLLNELENEFKIRIIKTKELFCTVQTNKCFLYKENELLYSDQVHLSISGGKLITDKLKLFLEN